MLLAGWALKIPEHDEPNSARLLNASSTLQQVSHSSLHKHAAQPPSILKGMECCELKKHHKQSRLKAIAPVCAPSARMGSIFYLTTLLRVPFSQSAIQAPQ